MVSVIIPVYKVEKYLPQCVESVMQQTYSKIEIILVDDGSPDRCAFMCDCYAVKDKRIKVLHQANGGLSKARNSGIEVAQGEFITFVDSDDFLISDMIECLVKLAERENADFVACKNMRCKDVDTPESVVCENYTEKIGRYEMPREKMRRFLQGDEINTTAWAKLYKTSLFLDIRYPADKCHEDVYTTYKLVHKAKKIVTTSKVGYVYRENPNSITTSAFSEKRLDSVEGKREQLAFICNHYPELQKEAETGVIYACNQCLLFMAKAGYKNKIVVDNFQKLYKKYGKSYLSAPVSAKGKALTCVAMFSVRVAHYLLEKIR